MEAPVNTPHIEAAESPHAAVQVPKSLSLRQIYTTWWPLAASWLLMGTELPLVSAAMARLADPRINLAAYGGVVFALALIIESPIIMLLAASTALSKDQASYRKLRRFMMVLGAALTLLHLAIAFTPMFYWVVRDLIGAPAEILEPSRIGLQIMVPWTWFIAYRRFNQGVLIRFEKSRIVGAGTLIRLTTMIAGLILGFFSGSLQGIVVGTSAVIAGVIVEAVFIGIMVRPVIRDSMPTASGGEPLDLKAILQFYVPLAMTSLIFLLVQPLGSAAMSRMPRALDSLAVWPVIGGLAFMVRSLGIAYMEVVVALIDRVRSSGSLRRFTGYLALFTLILVAAIAVSPASGFWFRQISGLPVDLAELAETAIWLVLLWPALNVFQSWYQGALMFGRRTRAITEAVLVFLVTSTLTLLFGVLISEITGLYVALAAAVLGSLMQTLWLKLRSRDVLAEVYRRDANGMDLAGGTDAGRLSIS